MQTISILILAGLAAVLIFVTGYFLGRRSRINLRYAMKIDGEICRKVLGQKYVVYRAAQAAGSDIPLWLNIERFSVQALDYVRLKHPLVVLSPDLFWSTLFQAVRMSGIEKANALNEARRIIDERYADALPSQAVNEVQASMPSIHSSL